MARKKTKAALVFALPGAMSEAVLSSMTPDQRDSLTGAQASEILQTTTRAATEIAAVLDWPEGELPLETDGDLAGQVK